MTVKFEPGTVYDVAHLRPFDLEMALQGHPLSDEYGYSARLFRMLGINRYGVDMWTPLGDNADWQASSIDASSMGHWLRLAPLAIRDGRPLHVGDEIEVRHATKGWVISSANLTDYRVGLYRYVFQDNGQLAWRWPESKA